MSKQMLALCLAGPTGAGKTEAALHLAKELNGEVINTDSRQVYEHFPIITAQPSVSELAFCAHHLYGFMPIEQKLSAGKFVDMALDVARDVCGRGKIPIFVGGTGLYFKALLEGIAKIPSIDEQVSKALALRLKQEGAPNLHKELMGIDSIYAKRIHPNDSQRVVRALEVYVATGKTFTWWHEHAMPKPEIKAFYMGVDTTLHDLTPRLGMRIELMLQAGALDEARAALDICADKNAPAWSGIGCAELYAHLCEGLNLDDCIELWRKNTRAYAKRQLTWFRAAKNIHWFAVSDLENIIRKSKEFIIKPD